MDQEQLRFPIGRYTMVKENTPHVRRALIDSIRVLPDRLSEVVISLDENQLDTPYRPEGWTVRQVVHHVADSHVNSYVRYHWALSEDQPVIKAYDQMGWASLPDAKTAPIWMSLDILTAIHTRWSYLLDHMSSSDFERQLSHPEWDQKLSLDQVLGQYAWHGAHHMAHITSLIDREGWD
ncbi:MAG: YfiT family bacillithiol transferase [Bacteroidota bacterium]